ncbi:hypothetical protein R3W88_017831 [Solanum pinnatisectum]|uniref:RING-type domain-containing protein n=1 Tax=Solanum pinnatisectum TaxID=50273 RepID=A0AAV9L262_9SOLN|nr:hypothetical protein R3W88_017831 [Solanum pinnatisectum]
MKGADFKWYDGFFLSMLATNIIIVAINWKRYHLCIYPLHIWIMVDYTTVLLFRLLMFVDNGLAAGMGLDLGWQQRYTRFRGRIVVLSILALFLYPFLWWLTRRQAHSLRAQQGIPTSKFGVLVDMIRVPDWTFAAAGQEMRAMGPDATSYHPGLYLTQDQTEAVEALIQELPKFRLKAVPTDCSECLICLEEFRMGNVVCGLPCAHNFHVECIDEWLRLNGSTANVVTAAQYVRSQPSSQSYLLRMQGLLRPVRTQDTGLGSEVDPADSSNQASTPHSHGNVEPVQVVVEQSPREQ